MAFLCPSRAGRKKEKKGNISLLAPPSRSRITDTWTIKELVELNEQVAESKRIVLRNFTACADQELSVKQGQKIRLIFHEGDWAYITTGDKKQGFVPFSYLAQLGSLKKELDCNASFHPNLDSCTPIDDVNKLSVTSTGSKDDQLFNYCNAATDKKSDHGSAVSVEELYQQQNVNNPKLPPVFKKEQPWFSDRKELIAEVDSKILYDCKEDVLHGNKSDGEKDTHGQSFINQCNVIEYAKFDNCTPAVSLQKSIAQVAIKAQELPQSTHEPNYTNAREKQIPQKPPRTKKTILEVANNVDLINNTQAHLFEKHTNMISQTNGQQSVNLREDRDSTRHHEKSNKNTILTEALSVEESSIQLSTTGGLNENNFNINSNIKSELSMSNNNNNNHILNGTTTECKSENAITLEQLDSLERDHDLIVARDDCTIRKQSTVLSSIHSYDEYNSEHFDEYFYNIDTQLPIALKHKPVNVAELLKMRSNLEGTRCSNVCYVDTKERQNEEEEKDAYIRKLLVPNVFSTKTRPNIDPNVNKCSTNYYHDIENNEKFKRYTRITNSQQDWSFGYPPKYKSNVSLLRRENESRSCENLSNNLTLNETLEKSNGNQGTVDPLNKKKALLEKNLNINFTLNQTFEKSNGNQTIVKPFTQTESLLVKNDIQQEKNDESTCNPAANDTDIVYDTGRRMYKISNDNKPVQQRQIFDSEMCYTCSTVTKEFSTQSESAHTCVKHLGEEIRTDSNHAGKTQTSVTNIPGYKDIQGITEFVSQCNYDTDANNCLPMTIGDILHICLVDQYNSQWYWAFSPKLRKYGFVRKEHLRAAVVTIV